jgi:hypothetical protein
MAGTFPREEANMESIMEVNMKASAVTNMVANMEVDLGPI